MPHVTLRDPTQILPMIHRVDVLLGLLAEAGRRYSEHIQETTALQGDTHRALIANGDKIANACEQVRSKACSQLDGIRQVAELGVFVAIGAVENISSIEIPDGSEAHFG